MGLRSRRAVRGWLLLALALVALEGLLRLWRPAVLEFARAHRLVHRYSPEWYVDLAPSSRARFHMPAPDGRPWLDFTLATDDRGLRAAVPRHISGPPRHLHAVGDSFTLGWGVEAHEAWPSRLEAELAPDVRVLNLGVDGFGVVAATQKSMRLAERAAPAHAVLLMVPNDFGDDERAVGNVARGAAWHALMRAADALRRHTALAGLPFAARYWLRFRGAFSGHEPQAAEPTGLALRAPALSELPAARGPHPTFEALDFYARYLRARGSGLTLLVLYQGEPFARDSLQLYRYALEQGYEPLLVEPPPALCLPVDGHLNAAGNRALAELVRARLPAGFQSR